MSWLAILCALVALPMSLFDRRTAVILIFLAASLIAVDWLRGRRPRARLAALICSVLAALVAGWSISELIRPAPRAVVDEAAYRRAAEGSREVQLPFSIATTPITRLALLELEPDADSIYEGFEPQLIDRGHERGIRIIGYRHDGYVDFYDDIALTPEPDIRSDVTKKGIKTYTHTDLGNPVLERDEEGRAHVTADFTDVEDRRVVIAVHEATTRHSKPFNLLAPVGWSSVEPNEFPLFVMNDFDFLRTSGAQLEVRIDDVVHELAGFPIPLPFQGQARSFAKIALNPEIIALFPADHEVMPQVSTEPGTDLVRHGPAQYLFDGDKVERIRIADHEIVFEPALDLTESGSGEFSVTSVPARGRIVGPWQVTSDGKHAELRINIERVRVPHQSDVGTRLVTGHALKFFKEWPKGYEYVGKYNLEAGTIDATWMNHTPESRDA